MSTGTCEIGLQAAIRNNTLRLTQMLTSDEMTEMLRQLAACARALRNVASCGATDMYTEGLKW